MINEQALLNEHASMRRHIKQAEDVIQQARGGLAVLEFFLGEIAKAKKADAEKSLAAAVTTDECDIAEDPAPMLVGG